MATPSSYEATISDINDDSGINSRSRNSVCASRFLFFLNAVLVAVGAIMIVVTILWVTQIINNDVDISDCNISNTIKYMDQRLLHLNKHHNDQHCSPQSEQEEETESRKSTQTPTSLRDAFNENDSNCGFEKWWFIFLFAGCGAYTIITASMGMHCSFLNHRTNSHHIRYYIILVCILLVFQITMTVLIVANPGATSTKDCTGEEGKLHDWIFNNNKDFAAMLLLLLLLLIVEISALISAIILLKRRLVNHGSIEKSSNIDHYSIYHNEYDYAHPISPLIKKESFDVVHLDFHNNTCENGTKSSTDHSQHTNEPNDWNLRIREKYDIDTSEFQYDPEYELNRDLDQEREHQKSQTCDDRSNINDSLFVYPIHVTDLTSESEGSEYLLQQQEEDSPDIHVTNNTKRNTNTNFCTVM